MGVSYKKKGSVCELHRDHLFRLAGKISTVYEETINSGLGAHWQLLALLVPVLSLILIRVVVRLLPREIRLSNHARKEEPKHRGKDEYEDQLPLEVSVSRN